MEHRPAKNQILKQRLNEAIDSGSVFHAYIFLSEHRDAAEVFAKDFIKAMLTHRSMDELGGSAGGHGTEGGAHGPGTAGDAGGTVTGRDAAIMSKVDGDHHEDVVVIRKDGTSTRIKQIRDMQARISIRPIGERHIVLIADGDEMQVEAQNALLKTLEEPPGDTVLIILSDNIENMLPTVRSRSVICTVEIEENEESETINEAAGQVIELAAGGAPYYKMKKVIAPVGESKVDIRRFIDRTEEICRDRLFKRDEKGIPYNQEKTIAQIGALEEARNKLERGMSPRYIVKELLLRIGG